MLHHLQRSPCHRKRSTYRPGGQHPPTSLMPKYGRRLVGHGWVRGGAAFSFHWATANRIRLCRVPVDDVIALASPAGVRMGAISKHFSAIAISRGRRIRAHVRATNKSSMSNLSDRRTYYRPTRSNNMSKIHAKSLPHRGIVLGGNTVNATVQ